MSSRLSTTGIVLFVAALTCVALQAASAQEYKVTRCQRIPSPMGWLHGVGQVSYLLDKDGHPDTASLRVVGADSISLGGVRSAATRFLSTCTFEPPGSNSPPKQSVLQTIRFVGLDVKMSSAMATAALESDFSILPPPLPTEPVRGNDPVVEERPREISCARHPVYPPLTQLTFVDAQALSRAWFREYSGSVTAQMVVGADGLVEPGSLTITGNTNSVLVNIYRPVFPSCRFLAGRISGVPVRTIVTVTKGVSSSITFP